MARDRQSSSALLAYPAKSRFLHRITSKKAPAFAETFLLVTHIRGTWKTVIEDLTRLSELLDDGEADNV